MEPVSLAALPSTARRDRAVAPITASDHRLFVVTAVVAVVVVGVGSGAGLAGARAPGARPVTPLVLLHAAVFAGWVVLYSVQVALVASDRTAVHRRLGYAGAALALAMLSIGYAVAIHAARTGYAPVPGGNRLSFLVVPLGDLVVFAIWRRTAAIHKRMMWLATTTLMFASVTRLPYVRGHIPAILLVFLAVLLIAPVYERVVYGRVHRVTAWGSTAMLLQLLLRRPIGATIWWHTFAAWLIK
jgi:hypothetical protein